MIYHYLYTRQEKEYCCFKMDNIDLSRSSFAEAASYPVPFAVLGACKKRKEGKRSPLTMCVKCFIGQLELLRLLMCRNQQPISSN